VLNFIPYVGAAIVIATLFVVGLLVFSALSHAVIAPLAYLGITALEGQCITPTLLGHRLTINPFLVFSLHRMLELDVGTGRRVLGRAHSLVRDGGGAAAVLDRRRECRPTRDRCGWSGALGER
jgi:hypothetical protein